MKRPDVVRDLFLIVLVGCGGAFDAAAYLRVHTFTANMTGNTVLLALALGGLRLRDVAHGATAIAAFFAGAFLGTIGGREASDEHPWPARMAIAFTLEIVLLIAAAAVWPAANAGANATTFLALGAGAMGVQSGITHDIHLGGASSTYMTGTIARTAEHVAALLRLGFRGGLVLNGAAWCVYFAAALGVGVLGARHLPLQRVLWAIAIVVAVVAAAGRPAVLHARRSSCSHVRSVSD